MEIGCPSLNHSFIGMIVILSSEGYWGERVHKACSTTLDTFKYLFIVSYYCLLSLEPSSGIFYLFLKSVSFLQSGS